jgi:hypothetical protein
MQKFIGGLQYVVDIIYYYNKIWFPILNIESRDNMQIVFKTNSIIDSIMASNLKLCSTTLNVLFFTFSI